MIKYPFTTILKGAKIGKGTKIGNYVEVGKNVVIGANCSIQAFCFIPEGVTLEDNVFVGPCVGFFNDRYPPSKGKYWAKTLIKKGAIIGGHSAILPGVTIGEGAMIGAGSVVTKDVPKGEVWCGNPARFYKKVKDIKK